MPDPYLESLLNSPIRDNKRASKIWLPEGRLPPKNRVRKSC